MLVTTAIKMSNRSSLRHCQQNSSQASALLAAACSRAVACDCLLLTRPPVAAAKSYWKSAQTAGAGSFRLAEASLLVCFRAAAGSRG